MSTSEQSKRNSKTGKYVIVKKSQRAPLKVIEKDYGKDSPVKNSQDIRRYLSSNGHESLSRLLAH